MFGENELEQKSHIDDLLYGIFDNESWDKDVQETAKKCSEEGNVSSMIKLELKTKIQLQKVKRGENFDVEWRQENDTYQLTPEDLEKRKELKERNKMSARKHRIKKKGEKLQIQKQIEELSKKNAVLKQTVEELESLRNKICIGFGIVSEEKAA